LHYFFTVVVKVFGIIIVLDGIIGYGMAFDVVQREVGLAIEESLHEWA
jgi:hypothetical protein